jgi:leucyl-tRNA synthetase
VLANEEVINGLSERGDHPVVRLPLRQWVLKITEYADRLEKGLEGLDWPSGTMVAQQQWIGKSEGTEIEFGVEGMEDEVRNAGLSCLSDVVGLDCALLMWF